MWWRSATGRVADADAGRVLTMAADFSVQVADLGFAADAFAELRVEAAFLMSGSALVGTGGMAGRDPTSAAWRARYDAVVAAEWAALGAAATTLGAIAQKLTSTADTYAAAVQAATATTGGPPPDRPPPGGGTDDWIAGLIAAGPPSSTGSGGPVVPDVLAPYFPGGDPSTLRAAATAWSSVAQELEHIVTTGDAAFRALLETGAGATFSAMREFWARQYTPCAPEALLNAVENGARLLSASCTALADLIDYTRTAIQRAARDAIVDMSPLELPAALLGVVVWGLPELELLIGTGALAAAYLDDYRNAYLFELDRLVEKLSAADEQRLRRVAVPQAPDMPVGVGLTDIGQIAGLGLTGSRWDTAPGRHPDPDMIHITLTKVTHVLRGDRDGGAHAPGTGVPGKSEFPRGWSDQEIIAAALDVARNPDTVTRGRTGDRWVAVRVRNGVRIRVVIEDDGLIWTAYPLSGPGVVRNPGRRRS